jgi:hypothetical protein
MMPDDKTEAAREIAKMISDLRKEAMDRVRLDVERELEKMEEEGFDPAAGRGRGPRWMIGG